MANALTTTKELKDLFKQAAPQIQAAVAKHLTPERLMRTALTVFSRTPQLQECTALSIVGCVVQAGELGLELSGPLGQAYMVPRFNKNVKAKEATFQVGYRGFYSLAYRSGQVRSFSPRMVYARDHFEYRLGTDARIEHVPYMGDDDPGEVRFYYCTLATLNGGYDFEVMSKAQVVRHMNRYAADQRESSTWKTHFDPMALKTPVRMLAKRAPLSVDFQRAAAWDELAEAGMQSQTLGDFGLGGERQIDAYEGPPASEAQKSALLEVIQQHAIKPKQVTELLARQGARTVERLTDEQADAMLADLKNLTAPEEKPADEA